jgi:L-rhamnose mutarotase
MGGHRERADLELDRDLFFYQTLGEELKNFQLATGDLEATLREHGVSNYSNHLNPETNDLFGYAEIESEEHWNAIAQTDVCQRWWAHMANIMATNPDKSPSSAPLVECFHMA